MELEVRKVISAGSQKETWAVCEPTGWHYRFTESCSKEVAEEFLSLFKTITKGHLTAEMRPRSASTVSYQVYYMEDGHKRFVVDPATIGIREARMLFELFKGV